MSTRGLAIRQGLQTPAPLKFYDSLQKSVRPFEPLSSDQVTWYSCGPTVYDASHMGHARNYVTTDILRRLLQDYFGYRVVYVQNVTDVDDKIIVRARQNLVFAQYVADCMDRTGSYSSAVKQIKQWWKNFAADHLVYHGEPADWSHSRPKLRDTEGFPKDQMYIDALTASAQALSNGNDFSPGFFDSVRDVVLYGIGASQVIPSDEMIKATKELTTYWEERFNDDMKRLNVVAPTKVTRVTEYMLPIVEFVQKIIDHQFAYVSSGSVYFNVTAFIDAGHAYAKLKPTSMAQADDLLQEAEGVLSTQIGEARKSKRDFAIWKASKPGEPAWDSPWGPGRPGWHIECSAMASAEFGSVIDIHSGGEDLTFPHHDNELAQSEAYHNNHEWVRYFVHTGHLHIRGLKMSKSLKNFITIEDAFSKEKMSARLMRLIFLSGKWRGRVDYNEDLIKGVKAMEQKYSEFFTQIRNLERAETASADNESNELEAKLVDTIAAVDGVLADDFDTPNMLSLLRELLNVANKTMLNDIPPVKSLLRVARYFSTMFEVVGIEIAQDGLGWAEADVDVELYRQVQALAQCRQRLRETFATSSQSPGDLDTLVQELRGISVQEPSLATFRQELAERLQSRPVKQDILQELDRFRDYTLVDLGIALDDRKNGFVLKPGERDEMVARREEKLEDVRQKAARKEAALAKEAEQMKKGALPAKDMFRHIDTFTQFDATGLPTHVKDDAGQELPISKSQLKKLQKEYQAQSKLNHRYEDWIGRNQAI
ncbi:tRNA synthetases class I (C) catalytic domain-domain-containing protein [Protomyces lactucae-debilis]|uniref:cysteine--tRNA ligase n=1 Tax=Protomyces lactucae-debilis TaxID=2754530 RepID=A0A1Y2F072_PROLT|nr:tRNA synthetases class I (C) catalytic domain-containing protein [Protomyces lactucae-debilis]ORY77282.1 tRNA synthetases class I (C) catalytic domain-domain-containing protein [Protomyces lactucae-debilis]